MPVHDAEFLMRFFSSTQMKHVLFEAAHVARVLLKVESSIIFLLSSSNSLKPASWDGREPADQSITLESAYVKSLWEGRRSILWHQRESCADTQVGTLLDAMNLNSGMILPLILQGQYCGMWMAASAAERSFTDSDESILQTLRENIALTTESMILSEDNFRLQRETNALYEIGKEISQLMDLNRVLKTIVEKTCSLMGAEISYLSLADHEAGEVRVVITEGMRGDEMRKMVLKFGEGVGGAVASTRSPELIPSYPKDPRPKSPLVAAQAASEGIESIISVPMFTRRGLIGVLFAASRRENVFNHGQMDFLAALGTHAAIAIENASLYEQEKITSEKLRATMTTHEHLLRLVLRNQGLQAISDTLSELVFAPVAIEDNRRRILCVSSPAPRGEAKPMSTPTGLSSADIWADPDLASLVHTLRETRQSVRIPSRPHRGYLHSRLIVPIAAGDDLLGYVVALEANGELNEQQRSAVEQASIVMALEFLKQEAAQAVEQRLAGDFLDDVINGRCANDPSAIQRAARLNVDLHASHLVMVLDVDRFSDEIAAHRWSDMDALSIKRRFLHKVTDIAHKDRPGSLVGMQSDSVLLLLPVAEGAAIQDGIKFGRKMQEALHTALPDLTVSIGIGRAVPDYLDLPQSYRDAQVALFASTSSRGQGRVVAYAELGILPLLLQSRSQADLLAFMHRHLDPLLVYDAQKESGLVNTLRAYLANNAHMQHTAEDCHIHINTLKYRMQRIEDLLGSDLSNGDARFNLQLALNIHSIRNLLEGCEDLGGSILD
jgi:sugar diacid utilization regulator/putative methionine-R-sulfoxide reductase with GAF domain